MKNGINSRSIVDFFAKINPFDSHYRLVILNYHSISKDVKPTGDWVVCKEDFDSQMKYLSDNKIETILLKDISDLFLSDKSHKRPKRYACITFDDGFEDNYVNALPILDKYNIKASFFIVAASLNDVKFSPYWIDQYPKQAKRLKFMSRQQVLDLHFKGHEIGSHTLTHQNLNIMSPNTIKKELCDSKTIIEKLLENSCTSLVLSFGVHGNKKKESIVKSTGHEYKYICQGRYGYVTEKTFKENDLPRVPIYGNDSQKIFDGKIRGKYGFASKLYTLVKRVRFYLKYI